MVKLRGKFDQLKEFSFNDQHRTLFKVRGLKDFKINNPYVKIYGFYENMNG